MKKAKIVSKEWTPPCLWENKYATWLHPQGKPERKQINCTRLLHWPLSSASSQQSKQAYAHKPSPVLSISTNSTSWSRCRSRRMYAAEQMMMILFVARQNDSTGSSQEYIDRYTRYRRSRYLTRLLFIQARLLPLSRDCAPLDPDSVSTDLFILNKHHLLWRKNYLTNSFTLQHTYLLRLNAGAVQHRIFIPIPSYIVANFLVSSYCTAYSVFTLEPLVWASVMYLSRAAARGVLQIRHAVLPLINKLIRIYQEFTPSILIPSNIHSRHPFPSSNIFHLTLILRLQSPPTSYQSTHYPKDPCLSIITPKDPGSSDVIFPSSRGMFLFFWLITWTPCWTTSTTVSTTVLKMWFSNIAKYFLIGTKERRQIMKR